MAGLARTHFSTVVSAHEERWHIARLRNLIRRFYHYTFGKCQTHKSIEPIPNLKSQGVQTMEDFSDEQYVDAVEQFTLLLEDLSKPRRHNFPTEFTSEQIYNMKKLFAHADAPGATKVRALLERLEKESVFTPQPSVHAKQDQQSVSVEDIVQEDGVSDGFETTNAPRAEQTLVSSEPEMNTVRGIDLVGPYIDSSLVTPPATAAASPVNGTRPSIVDMAFEQDTRLYGLHPASLDPEQFAKLDKMMPTGYRYARELQSDLVFIPPPNHPQTAPGDDFVIQKKGTCAVPIIKPPVVREKAARNAYRAANRQSRVVTALERNGATADSPGRGLSLEAAHQTVQQLSAQLPMSPASRVIAAVNASPPSQFLPATDFTLTPSPYRAAETQYHYNWQNTWHDSAHAADWNGASTSYFPPYLQYGQAQHYATPFDQTSVWGTAQYEMYEPPRHTPHTP
ncbi:hypothetical protein PMZ80_007254 [Knufia obscura]|nr:hypothetical protein PMZ80_007254 [Knufia obscura]